MEALKKVKEAHPQSQWWIKADGCDIRKGLRESMRGIWSGDEDLGDGSLHVLFNEYKARCSFVKCIGTSARLEWIFKHINKVANDLQNDLEFLMSGSKSANSAYNKAVEDGKTIEKTMMELAWNAAGFDDLIKKLQGLQEDLNGFVNGVHDVNLKAVKLELLNYLKSLFSKKRAAATHLLVFMIADELRNHKPYAIPARFMPYMSLTDNTYIFAHVSICVHIISSGFTTDGEFNSLQTMGHKCPISVIELIKGAKNQARHIHLFLLSTE